MTTIAAIQGEGWVVMASDSQSTLNDYKRLKMAGNKVYTNNGIMIAGCGQGRGLDLLHKAWAPPKPAATLRDLDKLDVWMAKIFIPSMRELFIEAGYDMKDDGNFAQHEGNFLIAVNGVLYYVDDDYSIDRDSRGYLTSGSGGDFAAGVLYAYGSKRSNSIQEAKKALTMSIAAAKEFDVYSGGETKLFVQE